MYGNYGTFIGTFGGTIALEKFAQMVEKIKMGSVGFGWIVEAEGFFLAHPDRSVILNLNVLQSSQRGYVGFEELGKQMIAGKTGDGLVGLSKLLCSSHLFKILQVGCLE